MPKNTRDWAKRKLKSAKDNLDWVMYHCVEIKEVYQEQHPDISSALDMAAGVALMVQEQIDNINDHI